MPPTSTLDDFQREFAAALLGEATSAAGQALAAQPGFAVYRNTVLRGCVDALAANYPTVATLVGGEWFEAAAGRFARAEPAARWQPRRLRRRASPSSWTSVRAGERAGLPGRRRPARPRLDRGPSRRRCTGADGGGARRLVAGAAARRGAGAASGDALGELSRAADLHHLAPPSRARAARRRARLARRGRSAHPPRRRRRLAGAGRGRGGLPRRVRARAAVRRRRRARVPGRIRRRPGIATLAAGAGRCRRLHPPGDARSHERESDPPWLERGGCGAGALARARPRAARQPDRHRRGLLPVGPDQGRRLADGDRQRGRPVPRRIPPAAPRPDRWRRMRPPTPSISFRCCWCSASAPASPRSRCSA